MKTFFLFVFFVSFLFRVSASDDVESAESLTEGREIAPLPQTDERINGYREDYTKPKDSLIELPKKYRKKEKEKIKSSEKKVVFEEPSKASEDEAVKEKKVENRSENLPDETEKTAKAGPESVEKPKMKPGYYGETVNGVREGKGKLVLENGDFYEGHWENGRKHGQGIYVYASGIKYNGTWKNDKMDGYGSLIFPDGSSYYGEFKDGAISGTGTFKYADKAEYSGEWKNGKWHGRGRFRLAGGREINAVFRDQQIVEFIKTDEDSKIRNNQHSCKPDQ